MKIHKLTKAILFSTLVLPLVAQIVYAAPTKTGAATKKKTGSAVAQGDPWRALKNPLIAQSMQKVMGNKFRLFDDRTQALQSVDRKGDEIFTTGGIEGLYTIEESAYCFNTKTHSIQVAILDNDHFDIWGVAKKSELSPLMTHYIADLEKRKGSSVDLNFEAPNQSTIEINDTPKTAAKKNLNLSSPTGTYERASQWDEATLDVVKLPGNKIKFGLDAQHAANMGGASGTIELKDNKGIYDNKEQHYQLLFEYKGSSFKIEQKGEGPFGGMNVYPDGVYKKTKDAMPKMDD